MMVSVRPLQGPPLVLPLSVVLLAGSLLIVGQRIDPTLLDGTPA